MWPVYEFRPLPSWTADYPMRGNDIHRFAEGKWIADDGEYDLAFVCRNICLYFDPPYQRNITLSWLTTHWTGHQPKHPNGNPWHYAIREGQTEWGGDWGRDNHPNYRAGRSGMDWACSQWQCANGRHVEMHMDDPHIAAGVLRERDTKKIVTLPDKPLCMYCGHDWLAQRKERAA